MESAGTKNIAKLQNDKEDCSKIVLRTIGTRSALEFSLLMVGALLSRHRNNNFD
jgi:hypothetical protein